MKKLFTLILLFVVALQTKAAPLTIEITQGLEGALPIAVVPFAWRGDQGAPPPHEVGGIVAADLGRRPKICCQSRRAAIRSTSGTGAR